MYNHGTFRDEPKEAVIEDDIPARFVFVPSNQFPLILSSGSPSFGAAKGLQYVKKSHCVWRSRLLS